MPESIYFTSNIILHEVVFWFIPVAFVSENLLTNMNMSHLEKKKNPHGM